MPHYFARLNYSFGNEDWTSEHHALRVKPGDQVLCITASGDRTLHMLLTDCGSVKSIDANPIQNNLLKLKIAALQKLEFIEYLSFLGAQNQVDRLKIFREIQNTLDKDSLDYWKKHEKMISRGVLYEGVVERLTRKVALIFNLIRHSKTQKLFSFENIEEQKKFVQEEWDNGIFKECFEFALSPMISRYIINDPGLTSNLPPEMHVGSHIYERMNRSLQKHLARENLLISLLLLGKVKPEAYPPYLREQEAKVIRSRLDRISCETINLLDYLKKAENSSIDCFSLSDVASYIPKEEFKKVLKEMVRTAKPGARFCIRQFLSSHQIPEEFEPNFKRDIQLEKQLEEEEHCFVYTFLTGKIHS